MNIVFFGTSEFALVSLEKLLGSRHKVLAVVTQPDSKKGRKLQLSQPPTKALALNNDIKVFQPVNASNPESIDYLKNLEADLFVVVSFGQILKSEVLSIPKTYAINLHSSLLPKYRGAAPINWAIINGDRITGVTVIRMNERMDEGDIILKQEVSLGNDDTYITLSEKLSIIGAEALLKTIDLIEGDKAASKPQNNSEATYAPKLKKEDGLIDWNEPAIKIQNKIKGLIPWPGAYTHYEGKLLKILKTELLKAMPSQAKAAKPGEVIDIVKDIGVIVHTGSENLLIKHVQLEGKRSVDTCSFLRGHKIGKGYKFI